MLTKSGAKLLDFDWRSKPARRDCLLLSTRSRLSKTGSPAMARSSAPSSIWRPSSWKAKRRTSAPTFFALGELIYEMASGKPPFQGKSRASLIAAILTVDPPSMADLQPMTPPALDRLVKKCLQKDPEDRWQSVSDLASELQWLAQSGSQATGVAAPRPQLKALFRRQWLSWSLALALAVAVALLIWRIFTESESTAPVVHLTADLSPQVSLAFGPIVWLLFVLSPDGNTLVFVGSENGTMRLYARRLDQWDAIPIRGTEGAERPFFSPDGQWLTFSAGGIVEKVPITGGPPIDIVEASWGAGSWSSEGRIIYTRAYNEGLWIVSASGSSPKMLTTPIIQKVNWAIGGRRFCPTTRRFSLRSFPHRSIIHVWSCCRSRQASRKQFWKEAYSARALAVIQRGKAISGNGIQ
jgi:eukaryotic-like serine/threonine-protein kinase